MPQAANITVKKNDGTTDVIYVSKTPSGGDGSAAVWRADAVGSALAFCPELRLLSREADQGKKRALRATYMWPQTALNSTTGVTSVINRAMASSDWSMSKDMTAVEINEFVSQFANLLAATLIKDCIKTGHSAT